jgi:hypothetical protein
MADRFTAIVETVTENRKKNASENTSPSPKTEKSHFFVFFEGVAPFLARKSFRTAKSCTKFSALTTHRTSC